MIDEKELHRLRREGDKAAKKLAKYIKSPATKDDLFVGWAVVVLVLFVGMAVIL